VLGLQSPGEPFTERRFLQNELARKTPIQAKHKKVLPSDVPIDPSSIEEGEKVYFVRWLPHGPDRHVTEENLRKTGELISWQTAEACSTYNVSTCWSAHACDARDIDDPIEARRRSDLLRPGEKRARVNNHDNSESVNEGDEDFDQNWQTVALDELEGHEEVSPRSDPTVFESSPHIAATESRDPHLNAQQEMRMQDLPEGDIGGLLGKIGKFFFKRRS
jgi:hypothetical protein